LLIYLDSDLLSQQCREIIAAVEIDNGRRRAVGKRGEDIELGDCGAALAAVGEQRGEDVEFGDPGLAAASWSRWTVRYRRRRGRGCARSRNGHGAGRVLDVGASVAERLWARASQRRAARWRGRDSVSWHPRRTRLMSTAWSWGAAWSRCRRGDAVFDELSADDGAIRPAVGVGLRDLGHPLLDQTASR
jgi:hypothetical protein